MGNSRKLQLLFVWFGTRVGHIGGGVVRLLETNRVLHHFCDYYMITQRETYHWLKELGLKAEASYFVGGTWAWIATIPALLACLISTVLHRSERRHIDLIYSSTHSFLHVFPSLLMKFRYRAKLVVYVTLSPFPRFRGRSILEYLILWFDRVISLLLAKIWGDKMIVVNKADAEELYAFGFERERVYVAKYGVDQETINQTVGSKREVECLFLGRLAPAKGVIDLLDAWKQVSRVIGDAKLVFVGPAWIEVLESIKRKTLDLGLISNVEIAGSLFGQDKYQALKRSKLLVMPSYEDTWCIAICEAMACGCAVVAYALPALRAVYGESILWAKIGDKTDLARKILRLLENEAERTEYANRSREFASKLDWKTVALDELQNIKNLL